MYSDAVQDLLYLVPVLGTILYAYAICQWFLTLSDSQTTKMAAGFFLDSISHGVQYK